MGSTYQAGSKTKSRFALPAKSGRKKGESVLIKYKLYVLKPYEYKVEELVSKYKYVRASIFYALVYTNRRAPKDAILVKRPQVLNSQEKAWVMSCNMQIESELMANSQDVAYAMKSFLKDLETELRAEREALKKEA